MTLLRYIVRSNRQPWERSVLELAIELDIPDWDGIKRQLEKQQWEQSKNSQSHST